MRIRIPAIDLNLQQDYFRLDFIRLQNRILWGCLNRF